MHSSAHTSPRPSEDRPRPPFDPSIDVPEHLQGLLIATGRSHIDHERAQEDRLRRTLRRFQNQIQHGCKNLRCDVPTCFSYRRRVAGGPLRPYNDVTARALAIKCVEQYASRGRDLAQGIPNRDKSKKQKGKEPAGEDGLCYSEPVVPWYTDPKEYLRERDAAAAAAAAAAATTTTRTTAPRLNGNVKVGSRARSRQDERPLGVAQNGSAKLGNNAQYIGLSQLGGSSVPKQADHGVESENLPEKTETEPNNAKDIARQPNGHVSETTSSRSICLQRKKDSASLSQFLFDAPELRSLDQPPRQQRPRQTREDTKKTSSSASDVLTGEWSDAQLSNSPSRLSEQNHHIRRASKEHNVVTTARGPSSFRLLPAFAIRWLGHVTSLDYEDASEAEQEKDVASRPSFDLFVEASVRLVLSNALPLIQSASTWDLHADPISLLGSDHSCYRTTSELAVSDPRKLTKNNDLIMPTWAAIVEVCGAISRTLPESGSPWRLMDYIIKTLNHGYILPSWLKHSKHAYTDRSKNISALSNQQVAHLIVLLIAILSVRESFSESRISKRKTPDWALDFLNFPKVLELRNKGHAFMPSDYKSLPLTLEETAQLQSHFLAHRFQPFDYHVDRLTTGVADLISHRLAVDVAAKAHATNTRSFKCPRGIVHEIVAFLQHPPVPSDHNTTRFYGAARLLEYMQIVLLTKWDRMPLIERTSPVGGALEMLKGLYQARQTLNLPDTWFELPFLSDALDEVEVPFAWLSFKPDEKRMHILEFSCLFPPKALVRYFRSLNLKIMKNSHEKAMAITAHGKAQLLHNHWRVNGLDEILEKARPHMARYFVMTISRSNMLEDAIGQIWHRERQELMRPLKVLLGKDEGEQGLDHGGVQQEFFRLIFAEAFDPKYGMFDTDETTHMSWFKPGALEPRYKYEALGVLMGLAIYNGVTVPVNLPLAFYRKLLGLKVDKLEHIEDGWPELAKNLKSLLEWEDGDVSDVIGRTYEFSYEAFGKRIDIDMWHGIHASPLWKPEEHSGMHFHPANQEEAPLPYRGPLSHIFVSHHLETELPLRNNTIGSQPSSITTSPSASQAPLVTNATRQQYVKDYIHHLTETTISCQLSAFLKGLNVLIPCPTIHSTTPSTSTTSFSTPTTPSALPLFHPSHLKLLFEGHPSTYPLEISPWRAITTYDDYTPIDRQVEWFWEIVESWGQQMRRKLLLFVTASDRLPVGGWENISFIVQRSGDGEDDDTEREDEERVEEQAQAEAQAPSEYGVERNDANLERYQSRQFGNDSGGHAGTATEAQPASTADQNDQPNSTTSPSPSPRKTRTLRLPGASTCYRRLFLPAYGSKEVLRDRLEVAVNEGLGFGSV